MIRFIFSVLITIGLSSASAQSTRIYTQHLQATTKIQLKSVTINDFTTNMYNADSLSNIKIPTAKAVADYIRLRGVSGGGTGGSSDKITTISISVAATTASNIYLVTTTSSDVTLTINPVLFYTAGVVTIIRVKKITDNFNSVIIVPSSGLINGSASYTLTLYNESIQVVSDGTNLFTL